MKKKLEDITVGEIRKECEAHRYCSECPFDRKMGCNLFSFLTAHEEADEEIELTEA